MAHNGKMMKNSILGVFLLNVVTKQRCLTNLRQF